MILHPDLLRSIKGKLFDFLTQPAMAPLVFLILMALALSALNAR